MDEDGGAPEDVLKCRQMKQIDQAVKPHQQHLLKYEILMLS